MDESRTNVGDNSIVAQGGGATVNYVTVNINIQVNEVPTQVPGLGVIGNPRRGLSGLLERLRLGKQIQQAMLAAREDVNERAN